MFTGGALGSRAGARGERNLPERVRMAVIVYEGPGDADLAGGQGADTFRVSTEALGSSRVRLADPDEGGRLVLEEAAGGPEGGRFLRVAGRLAWETEAGGQIRFAGPPGPTDALPETVIWRAEGLTVERLTLTLDLAPPEGRDLALVGTAGADTIEMPGSGAGRVAGWSAIWADRGADTVVTSPDQKTLVRGGPGADHIRTGGAAAGVLHGEAGADVLAGCGGNDSLFGGGGADLLVGCLGRDDLRGGGRGDSLFGGEGRDRLRGGNGADTLAGEAGNDRLWGGKGADLFAFQGTLAEGFDRVMDFRDGVDRLRIAGAGLDDLAISEAGQGARIDLDSGTAILLLGIAAAALDADDFLFV